MRGLQRIELRAVATFIRLQGVDDSEEAVGPVAILNALY